MKLLSERMLDRKRSRFAVEIREHIARWRTMDPFSYFRNKPTDEESASMFEAAKFGPGDPLTQGGDRFAFEYILDELSVSLEQARRMRLTDRAVAIDPDGDSIRVVSSQSEDWGNLMFVFDVDATLAEHWSRLTEEDFDYVTDADGMFGHAAEKDTGAFGFLLGVRHLAGIAEANEEFGSPLGFKPAFRPSPWKANDKCTVYVMTVGPLDRLLTPAERDKHGVQGFSRRTPSGGSAKVRPHERRNPRRLGGRAVNEDEVAHVVYRAFDVSGVLRYYGEGKAERPRHVNSGVSHNYKLNEHFFRLGPMRVEVFTRGLSKDEALSVERLCIRGHAGPGELWNIRDYEPRGEGVGE